MTDSTEASSSDDPNEPPTNVRFGVLGFLCVLAFIFYIDRICIGQAAPKMREDLGITKTQMGFVMAAFTLAYSLFEVPTGWWGDRYGSRGVMARIVVWWSVFTALTGAVLGLYSLMLVRFLFGAGEAGAFPNTARILSRWLPANRRGMAQGMVNSMAQLGGAVAPLLTAHCIERIGWRWTFVVFSVPGFAWVAAFYWWFRDDPATHPGVNAAELNLIHDGQSVLAPVAHPPIPWRAVWSHLNVYLLGGVLACTAFNTYFYFTWYPTYLKEGRGVVDSIESGKLGSLVLAGGAIGCLSGGFIIDWLLRRVSSRRWCRGLWGSFALTTASICLMVGVNCDDPSVAATWTAASVMMALSTLASWWGAVTDISGPHLGALFGLMNSMGGLGAIVSQLFVGPFVDWMEKRGFQGRGQWDPAFYVYAGVLLIGACGWLLIDSTKTIRGTDQTS